MIGAACVSSPVLVLPRLNFATRKFHGDPNGKTKFTLLDFDLGVLALLFDATCAVIWADLCEFVRMEKQ